LLILLVAGTAAVTGVVALIAAITNLMNPDLPIIEGLPIGWGAWVLFLLVPFFVWLFLNVKRHYAKAAKLTALPPAPPPDRPIRNLVVVPVSRLHRPALQALRYAKSLSPDVIAVHVRIESDPTQAGEASAIEEHLESWGKGIPLTIIESPYRSLTEPLLQYLEELKKKENWDVVTVVLPEYIPDSWWEHTLHGQSAQVLKLSLLFTPGFVVTSVPSHEDGDESQDILVPAGSQVGA
jgi:hypothetical protein